MYWAALWACFLLSLPQADLSFGRLDPLLDPNRVTWWCKHWSPGPLVLSSNHINQIISLTVYFSPTTSLSNGALDITFPPGFSPDVHHIFGVNYIGGEDYEVTIEGVRTPGFEGGYEPFTVRTWYNFGGQLADVNLNFGSVYIYGDPKELNTLDVSVVGAGTPINQADCELSFKFTVRESAWRFDLVTISIDPQWSVASGALCYSSGLLTSNSSDFTPLQCLVTPSTRSIYIHGLSAYDNDTENDRFIDIRVTSVTSPDAVYPSSSWTVAFSHLTAATVLWKITSFTTPSLANGQITSASWTPTWGTILGGIGTGQTLFFDLQFRVTNAIPKGNSWGYINIDLSEQVSVDLNWLGTTNAENCYVLTYLHRNTQCSIVGRTIVISQLPDIKAGSSISVRNVVKVTSAAGSLAKILAIRTYKGDTFPHKDLLVDIGRNLAAFQVANLNSIVPAFFAASYHAPGSDTAIWTTGGSYIDGQLQNYGLQFVIGSSVGMTRSSSQVVIQCPFSANLEDFAIAVPSPIWQFDTNEFPGIQGNMSETRTDFPLFSPGISGKSLGSITFPGTITAQTFKSYLHLEAISSNGPPYIQLPRIAANYATAYECRVSISTPELPTQTSYIRLPFLPGPWKAATVAIPCNDRVEGLPVIIDIQPSFALFAEEMNRSFYVEVEFSNEYFKVGLGANLAFAQITTTNDPLFLAFPYPFSALSPVPTSAHIYTTTASSVVALSGFAPFEPSQPVRFCFPVGGFTDTNTLQMTIRSVHFLKPDPRYRFISQQTTTSALSLGVSSKAWTGLAAVAGTNEGVSGGFHPGLSIDAYFSSEVPDSAWNYIILPPGFTFSSSRALTSLITGADISQIYWFSSPTGRFPFPGVLFSNTQSLFPAVSHTAGSLTLSGFKVSIGAATAQVRVVAGGATGAACSANGTFQFQSFPGEIQNIRISPASVPQRSPNTLVISHTMTFTLPTGAPANSLIRLEFDTSKWTNPGKLCSGCTVAGLAALYSDDNVTCELVGQRAEVRYYAAVPAFSTISISIYGLVPPREPATLPFLVSLSTLLPTYGLIAQASSLSGSTVTITPVPGLPGRPIWLSTKVFPPTVRTTEAYLYLRFSLPHALPACGEIAIFSPVTLTRQGNYPNYYCYTSPIPQSSCNVVGNAVYLTLSRDLQGSGELELFLEEFVTNPVNMAPLREGFRLKASFGGQITDMDTVSSSQIYRPTPILTTLIVGSALSPISFTTNTAADAATYTLDFHDLADFAVNDEFWIMFPQEYDNFLGNVQAISPNEYFIDCSCPRLAVTTCQVDRRTVIVKGNTAVPARTRVVITIKGVRNVYESNTFQFKVYHVSAKGEFVSVNQKFGFIRIERAVESDLEVKGVILSENRLFREADYVFSVSFKGKLDGFCRLQVEFPVEFSLMQEKYECNATLRNITSANSTEIAWNSAPFCENSDNFISFPAPSSPITITKDHLITLSVQKVANPQFCLSKSPNNTTFWSNKFNFFLHQSQSYTVRSYTNTNQVYVPFKDTYKSFTVNNYDPVTKNNRIIVRAGTQSGEIGLYTAGEGRVLTAKEVVFRAVTYRDTLEEGKLRYTSGRDKWVMRQGGLSMQFRVAAALNTAEGFYYIDWLLNETVPTGGSECYRPPVRTLVEVVSKQAALLSIAPVPSLPTGSSSPPIQISTPNPPHTDVQVTISLSPPSPLITLTPSILGFSTDVNTQYFQVQVAGNYDLSQGSVFTLWFALSGVDAFAYYIVPSIQVQIYTPNWGVIGPGTVLSWSIGNITKTSCFISPITDQIGVVYYHLAVKGRPVPAFATLKDMVSGNTPENEAYPYPEIGETWENFQYRLYKDHLQTQAVGFLPIYSLNNSQIVSFNWLWASTEYQIAGYLDNLSPEMPSKAHIEYFSTAKMAPSQPFTLSFQGLLYAAFNITVQKCTAAALGVPFQRIQGFAYSTHRDNSGFEDLNAVLYTEFTYILLESRFSDLIEPADRIFLSDTEIQTLQSNFALHRLSNPLISLTKQAELPTRSTPTWLLPLSPGNSTSHSLTLYTKVGTAGKTCCVAVPECAVPPSPEQVLLGLSAANSPVSAACVPTDLTGKGNFVDLGGLQSRTSYCGYCVAADDYPLWRTLSRVQGPLVLTTLREGIGMGDWGRNLSALVLMLMILTF